MTSIKKIYIINKIFDIFLLAMCKLLSIERVLIHSYVSSVIKERITLNIINICNKMLPDITYGN